MNTGIKSTGAERILRALQQVADAQTQIARSGTLSATRVFANACRDVSPGTTKQEVGRTVKANGPIARGRAGLMKIPKRGQTGKRPHGMYLTKGTKFIRPRHFIERALSASRPAALVAMGKSIERSITAAVSR